MARRRGKAEGRAAMGLKSRPQGDGVSSCGGAGGGGPEVDRQMAQVKANKTAEGINAKVQTQRYKGSWLTADARRFSQIQSQPKAEVTQIRRGKKETSEEVVPMIDRI